MVGIGVLGPLLVDGESASMGPRDRVVLGALAVRPGEVLRADQLADALWGEGPPASWPKVVQGCVVRLRKALGQAAIATAPGGYRLTLTGDDVDVCRFEHLVERGRALAATGEPDRAATTLSRALGLWRGNPFEDVERWAPARNEAARLAEFRRTVEEDVLEAQLAAGEHRLVATEGEVRAAEAPLRERRWATLALAQYRCGRQADALRTLSRARHTLVEELGLEPGPELVALEAAILRQDRELTAPSESAVVSGDCPYKGLLPYDVRDAEAFFGRDREVAACLGRLERAAVLVVAGPSGCGKSSLVRAGLVPRLMAAGRTVAMFTPGTDPDAAMTTALASAPGTPVVVVDQLEELFTIGGSNEAAGRFCLRLADYAVDRAVVVACIRADHLGELSADAAFARLVEEGLHLVRPLAGDELREAIEGPAAQAGLRLEHGLVDLLGRDLEGEPGALPLLSHALAETWRRRDGRVLTVDGYQATGGIRGAVARSAERLYETLPSDQQKVLRSVLLRLIALAPEGEPVRSRAPARSLGGDPARDRVVDLLVRARLVTTDEDSVDLAHEALTRAWPRLRGWLEESRTEVRLAAQLREAARSWDEFGRDEATLYRGARLVAVLDAVDGDDIALDPLEREFLDASRAREEAALTEARAKLRRERKNVRRLRGLLAGVGMLAVLATGTSLVALDQRGRAQEEGRVSTARELAAAATANLDVDPERSILLALEAVDQTRSDGGSVLPEAEEALHSAVTASRIVLSVPDLGGDLDWSPDGTVFVTEGPEETGIVDIRDPRTGESARSFHGHDKDVNAVEFNGDGSLLATTGDDGAARIWDPATGEEQWSFESSPDLEVWGPSFSPDGSMFAAFWPDAVRVMDLRTGQTVRRIDTLAAPGQTAFSPDGERIAISTESAPIAVVVDISSGKTVFTLQGHTHTTKNVAWSPDGRWLATASDDGSARIWNGQTGELRFALLSHENTIQDLAWSPDGTRLVTASDDGTAKVWSITEGGPRELLSLSAQDTRSGMRAVAFSPDGDRVMTGDEAITAVKIWDVGISGDAEVANLPGVRLFFGGADFTPDGRRLLATSTEGTVALWDPHRQRQLLTFGPNGSSIGSAGADGRLIGGPSGTDVFAIDVNRDGRLVATASADGSARVWDAATGHEAFTVHDGAQVDDITWSPTGEVLATATRDGDTGVVRITDRDGDEVATLREEPGVRFGSVSFSPDGRLLATSRLPVGRQDPDVPRVDIWDWEREAVVRTIDAPAEQVFFAPTGDRIATTTNVPAGDPAIVDIWDPATGHRTATLAHAGGVSDVALSPDGATLATAGADATVRLWDAETGAQISTLTGHRGLVTAVVFSPDGSELASVSADGTVRLRTFDLDELIEIARNELTRTLTDEECQQYLHEERCPGG
jgi:WD40 repeat protein/DNA-binding SARP family transcriptional activator